MRKPVLYIVMLLLLGSTAGCDSNDDNGDTDLTDAEVFLGNWILANLLLNGQDVSALLLAQVNVAMVFANGGSFDLTVTNADGTTTEIAGTYALNDAQKTLTLSSSEFEAPLTLDYTIQTEDRIILESDQPELLSELSGIDASAIPGLMVENVGLIVQRAAN